MDAFILEKKQASKRAFINGFYLRKYIVLFKSIRIVQIRANLPFLALSVFAFVFRILWLYAPVVRYVSS